MAVSDREAWARLRLAQGESSISTMELTSSQGQTTLTVGQSTGGDWLVREDGVAPIHFSLHWDGSTLRIADVYGAGGVRADGEVVGAQWRVLSGRVRVDFGKAAIVVETGSVAPQDSAKDPTPLPRLGSGGPGQTRTNKATLLGVAPIDDPAWAAAVRAAAPGGPEGASGTSSSESHRPARPGDTERPAKPTLLGLSSVNPPAPSKASPTPTGRPPSAKGTPSGNPLHTGTLMGMAVDPAELAAARAAATRSAPPAEREPTGRSDAGAFKGSRTSPEYSAGPAPWAAGGSASPPSGAKPSVSTARFGTVLQELPGQTPSSAPGRDTLPQGGVADGPGEREARPTLPPEPPPRYSDAPTVMRDPATLEGARSKTRFSWRGVGVGALTLVAYFAWLYLLDHL